MGSSRPTILGHAGRVTLPLRRQAADLPARLCTLHCCFFLLPFISSLRFEIGLGHYGFWLTWRKWNEFHTLPPQFLLLIHHPLEVVFKSWILLCNLTLDAPDLLKAFVISFFLCHSRPLEIGYKKSVKLGGGCVGSGGSVAATAFTFAYSSGMSVCSMSQLVS